MDSNDGDVTNQMYADLHVMCLYFCSILREVEFSRQLLQLFRYEMSRKLVSAWAELKHAEGKDRHEEANRTYRKFAKAPDNAT